MDIIKNKKIKISDFLPAVIFFISLTVYIFTLCPTVYVGDSSEFITNAVVKGINHAPGYPLHTLIGHLFNLIIPIASASYKINLLSAFAGAAAVTILFMIINLIARNKFIAASTALLFGFSFTFWSRSTIAEIYTLNIFFVALALYLLIKWNENRNPLFLLSFAFISGLGLSQHISGVPVAFAAVIFVIFTDRSILKKIPLLVQLLFLFALGFSIYLFVYFRSFSDTSIPFGNEGGFSRFLSFILPSPGAAKQIFKESSKISMPEKALWFFKQIMMKEFWLFGFLSVLSAIMIRGRLKIFLLLVGIIILNILLTIRTTINLSSDLDAHLLVSIFIFAVLIGSGLSGVISWTEKKLSLNKTAVVIISALFLVMPGIVFLKNKKENDRSENKVALNLASNLAAGIGKDGIVFTSEDEEVFLLSYLSKVEGRRQDIQVVTAAQLANLAVQKQIYNPKDNDRSKQLVLLKMVSEIAEQNIDKRPVYLTFEQFPINALREKFQLVPSGLVTRLVPNGQSIPRDSCELNIDYNLGTLYLDNRSQSILSYLYDTQFLYNAEHWDFLGLHDDVLKNIGLFEKLPLQRKPVKYHLSYFFKGRALLGLGKFEDAVESFTYALQYKPTDWLSLQGRGEAYLRMRDYDRARNDWQQSLAINPRNEDLRKKMKDIVPD